MSVIQYQGTGKRKTSVARVFLRPGKGIIKVNRREFEVYFPNPVHRMVIQSPLALTSTLDKFDILVNVNGGGVSGQAGAVRHGISPGSPGVQPGAAPKAESRRHADPRRPRGGAQEVRPAQGAQAVPVQQALVGVFVQGGGGRREPFPRAADGDRRNIHPISRGHEGAGKDPRGIPGHRAHRPVRGRPLERRLWRPSP